MENIRKMVFVCTGNICRSPMALGFGRREAEERGINIELTSAGISGLVGSKASRNAVTACSERDVDITSHRASQVDPTKDDDGTLYVCMTPQHIQWLRKMGVAPERTVMLGSGVPDPYGGDIGVYRRARDIIEMEIRALFDELEEQLPKKPSRSKRQEMEPEMAAIIAEMQECDLPDVAEIEAACFSDPWTEQGLAESLDDQCTTMLVALYDGVVCGYVSLMYADEHGYIPRVCVRSAYRRRGIASELMDTAETAARVYGCTDITLDVRESNSAAIALYESLGYRALGVRRGFYSNPIEAAVVMRKDLEPWEGEEQ